MLPFDINRSVERHLCQQPPGKLFIIGSKECNENGLKSFAEMLFVLVAFKLFQNIMDLTDVINDFVYSTAGILETVKKN